VSSRARERDVILPHMLPFTVVTTPVGPNRPVGDSSGNPVLATADEAKTAYPRKFFRCQILRLSVSAEAFFARAIDSRR
jgi:hypothetical protein